MSGEDTTSRLHPAAMKPRVDLLPPDALLAVAAVLGTGASEHGERSWERGRSASTDYAALLRHLFAWWHGEDVDPQSGQPHLAHASARMLILCASSLRGIGTDDRPHVGRAGGEGA